MPGVTGPVRHGNRNGKAGEAGSAAPDGGGAVLVAGDRLGSAAGRVTGNGPQRVPEPGWQPPPPGPQPVDRDGKGEGARLDEVLHRGAGAGGEHELLQLDQEQGSD